MELIADGILILAAMVAGLYCMVLSRRLRSLMQTEGGLGAAISEMSDRIDEMHSALASAKSANESSAESLRSQTLAATEAADRLERMIAEFAALEEKRAQPAEAKADDAPFTKKEILKVQDGDDLIETAAPAVDEDKGKLDGLLSSYLKRFEGDDEATIAKRLIEAMTKPEPLKEERAI